jgi:hypothetical protein
VYASKLVKLPNNLTVNGYLCIVASSITKLPKNLTVKGSLYAKNTQISEVPIGLIVTDEINCSPDSPLVNLAFEGYRVVIENHD